MSAVTASARSMLARCAASTSSRRAPGMRSAITLGVRAAASPGPARPAMTSVGASMARSAVAQVHPADRVAAARVALGGVPASIARSFATRVGLRVDEARA